METDTVIVLNCPNPNCSLRFSLPSGKTLIEKCPKCGNVLNSEIVIRSLQNPSEHQLPLKPGGLDVLLDNIRSILNVGCIFRTADGAGISKIYSCGITPTPENSKMRKTGLGSEWSVPWEYHANSVLLAQKLKQAGYQLIALERSESAQSVFDRNNLNLGKSILLIVGNELTGIDPELLELSDIQVSIPMAGFKRSLNVCVAFGIAAYSLGNLLLQFSASD